MPMDQYASFFFQYTFAATAATIVSGAVAERCEFIAYFAYSFVITGNLSKVIYTFVLLQIKKTFFTFNLRIFSLF